MPINKTPKRTLRNIESIETIDRIVKYARNNSVGFLDKETENALIKKAQEGDRDALEQVVNANILLTLKLARQYINSRTHTDVPDIISAGLIGLLMAIQKFDCNRGTCIRTILHWYIRNSIDDQTSIYCDYAMVPKSALSLTAEYQRIELRMICAGERPDERVIFKKMGLSEYKSEAIKACILLLSSSPDRSYDGGRGEYGENKIVDYIADKRINMHELEETEISDAMFDIIKKKIRMLPPIDSYIVKRRFLIGADHSYGAIAKELSLTRQRIEQRLKAALKKIKESITDEEINRIS